MTASEAVISPVTSAALYGKGIFTTAAIYEGKPFLWEKHWRRFCSNSEKVGIDLSEHTETSIKKALDEIVTKNGLTNGRARITFSDESTSKTWPFEMTRKTSLLIMTGEMRAVNENFRLTISPYQINSLSPQAGIKSCNYLDKILALDEAKARGFDETVQVNERGEITSATMANVFWLKDDILYTPSLKTGGLPGTTREFVIENLECREVEESLDKLHTADAIFLTSAGLGVVQVAEFESRKFEKIEHPILELPPRRI